MVSELLNICLQIIEALIAFYFYESISHLTNKRFTRLTIIIISYLIMCAVNLIFDYNVIANAISILFFHFMFSFCLYHQKINKSIFYPILFTCLMGGSEIGVIDFITFISGGEARDYIDNALLYSIHIVLSKSILFLAIKIVSSIINKFSYNEKFDFEFYIYPIVLLIVIVVFVIISYQNDLTSQSHIVIAVSSVILISVIIVTCILQQQSAKRKSELLELKAIQQKQDIENTYFELLEHQNEELQIFVHDIQKHLGNIYNLSGDSEKTKNYISNLSTDLSDSNKIGKTSNKLLDLIIDKYKYISSKQNIQLETGIHSSDLSFITDNDLTSIFNNLLDNAVDAAKKSSEKKITLSINSFGSMLTVDLSNSCDIPPVLKNDKLVSTKKEQGLHGYGFKSITKAVKKYNGDIEWHYNDDDKTFNISILFLKS